MVDPDKKIARPDREDPPEHRAKAAHVANLAGGTFVLGGLAGLIGLVFVGIALREGHQMAAKGALRDEGAWVVFLLPVIGAVFLAYAIWAALQVFWVGGDEDNDERLWARLSSEQRGRWRLRDAGRNVWGWRLWTGISLAALLYLDVVLWRLLAQAALAGRWATATAAVAFTAVMAYLALRAFRASYRPPEAAGVMVSQGRWVFTVPRDATLLILVIAMPFVPALMWLEKRSPPWPDNTNYYYLCAAVGFFCLVAGIAEVRSRLRDRRRGRAQVEIVRESDQPLALRCTLTLPVSPEDAARGEWTAQFAAHRLWSYGASDRRSPYGRWLDVRAAGRMEKGTGKVTFTLRADLSGMVESRASIWSLYLENPGGAHKPIELVLARDIVFPEEYPAV